MTATKRYLTTIEVRYVLENVLKEKDYFTQAILRDGIIAQLVFDDEDIKNAESCDDVVNYLNENSVDLAAYCNNYKQVCEMIDKYNSFDCQIAVFLEKVEKSIDELKLGDTIKELVEVKKPAKKRSTKKTVSQAE